MARNRKGRQVHGILLLDKPSGGSSNKVLQQAKRLFDARKAGHTGSLDPLATGMLPVCFGEATKISAYLLDADKGYEVTLKLGETTNTADADGETVDKRPVPQQLDEPGFTRICDRFKGPIQQIPPMVSAIKIDGQRLYKLARQGEVVDRPARSVTIHSLQVLSFAGDYARLAVRCSKGTYIRSLVTDIGDAIGCGAHVTALRRTFVSPFEQRPMIEMSALQSMAEELVAEMGDSSVSLQAVAWPALDALLLPMDAALMHLPALYLLTDGEQVFASGQHAACNLPSADTSAGLDVCRVYSESGLLLGLGQMHYTDDDHGNKGAARVAPRRVFQWN